jgi:anti-anti-sigma factor
MEDKHLAFDVRYPQSVNSAPSGVRISIIDLRGELSAFAGDALDSAYARATAQDPTAILLNFKDVHYINSTGIALLIGLIMQATKSRRRLLACGLSDHYKKIFQMAGLFQYIGIFPNEASALASVQGVGSHI